MADYSIISDISKHLVELLREHMCPELISLPTQIEIAEPGDKSQDYILGLFLYNIQEEKEAVLPRYQQSGWKTLQQAPKPYRLSFMLYLNNTSQANYKAVDIQRIIGRALQILRDAGQVQPNVLQPWLELAEPPVILSQDNISLDEKFQIWQAMSRPYQLSLFYQAAPVLIDSEHMMEIVRVNEARFSLEPKGERGR